jgi:hemin uptake protein HemP
MESTPNPRHPSGFLLAAAVAAPATLNRLDSRDLLRGAREIVIRHGDQEYRLRHTQNDKLILTK